MTSRHHVLLAVLLTGNALAFAGVDPVTQMLSALLVLWLLVDARQPPALPRSARWAAVGFGFLLAAQLTPLPAALRRLLQPGFAEVIAPGWSSLSLAPWSTLVAGASAVVAGGVALTAMRMAASRSGLPRLLALMAFVCGLLAVLGLAGESRAPEKVLLLRSNTGGGDVYGPFVNSNHFALAIELGLPAALALAAAAARNLGRPGPARQRAAVEGLAALTVAAVAAAAVLRSGSRGGVLFAVLAFGLSVPLWMRRRPGRRLPWAAAIGGLLVVAAALAWTRVPALRDGFAELLLVEGVEGNTRWDLWGGTVRSFARAPVLGSGLGSYAFVIGLDRPATGTSVLEEAHNDWLEWLSTTGLVGAAVLALLAAAVAGGLRPRRLRRLRHELRYPLAAAALALTAVGLHEIVDFGLQIPLNRYLLAVWVGLVFGVIARLDSARERAPKVGAPIADAGAEGRERTADATGLAGPGLGSGEDAVGKT